MIKDEPIRLSVAKSYYNGGKETCQTKHFHHSESQSCVFLTLEVEWPAGACFCLYTRVFMWRGVGASAAGASWFCPALPSHCTLWGSVLDPGPGPSLRHAALLQPLHSADSHWHYISWVDIVDVCACVDAALSLLLWSQTKWSADHLVSRLWICEVSSVAVEKSPQPWTCASYVEWRTWWHRAASSSGAWHIRPWGGGTTVGWCHADAS